MDVVGPFLRSRFASSRVPITELDNVHAGCSSGLGCQRGGVCGGEVDWPRQVGHGEAFGSQSALYLLRLSFASVRAVHIMRTTPLSSWPEQATEFDNLVRTTAEHILGCTFTQSAYEQ